MSVCIVSGFHFQLLMIRCLFSNGKVNNESRIVVIRETAENASENLEFRNFTRDSGELKPPK